MEDNITKHVITPLKEYATSSRNLVRRCSKPDKNEFLQIAKATGLGFFVMGFIGFFVKLIHIPINNIIVGA